MGKGGGGRGGRASERRSPKYCRQEQRIAKKPKEILLGMESPIKDCLWGSINIKDSLLYVIFDSFILKK